MATIENEVADWRILQGTVDERSTAGVQKWPAPQGAEKKISAVATRAADMLHSKKTSTGRFHWFNRRLPAAAWQGPAGAEPDRLEKAKFQVLKQSGYF